MELIEITIDVVQIILSDETCQKVTLKCKTIEEALVYARKH